MNKLMVLGIDQGLANLGFSIIEILYDDNFKEISNNVIDFGTIITNNDEEKNKRILKLFNFIFEKTKEYNFNIISCERLFFNIQKGVRNKSASIMDTQLTTGIICLASGLCNSEFKEFVPGSVKKYVAGSGRASKEDMKNALQEYCKIKNIKPKTEHEYDAIGIGLTGGRFLLEKLRRDNK